MTPAFRRALPLVILSLAAGVLLLAVFRHTAAGPVESPPARPAPDLVVVSVSVSVTGEPPAPIVVEVRGTLPDNCAEVSVVRQARSVAGFQIELAATGAGHAGCLLAQMPFQHSLPLETRGLPAGAYSVLVNGQRVAFRLAGPPPAAPPRAAGVAR